jgi:acetyltransferase-like isoleucine patch superfamily enzyme
LTDHPSYPDRNGQSESGHQQKGERFLKVSVWVGEEAKIIKGVSVGPDAVVGAAANVTKNVPSFCAVAGNPSKIVKENILV